MTETGGEQDTVPDQRWVQPLARDRVLDGFLAIDRNTIIHELHNGNLSGPITRRALERGGLVAALPHDPQPRRLVLVRQLWLPPRLNDGLNGPCERLARKSGPGRTSGELARHQVSRQAGYRSPAQAPRMAIYPSLGNRLAHALPFGSARRQGAILGAKAAIVVRLMAATEGIPR